MRRAFLALSWLRFSPVAIHVVADVLAWLKRSRPGYHTRGNAVVLREANNHSQAELDKAIATLNAVLFDAYNHCALDKFSSSFVDDVEFYHDQGGVTLGKAALTDSVKKNICGKTTRELVPGTLQVYYMKGYGAVEMGIHRFHHPGHEETEGVGEGKFIHLWQYKNGAWKITRVISYDHHAAAK